MANGLRFITGVRYYKGMLEKLNNMTYIFDPNWNINNSNKASFPVAFFHVKSYHEAMSSEVSQKQMLFYNSDEASNKADPSVDSGLLNIVADNIVIKPKVYKLDVIVIPTNKPIARQDKSDYVFKSELAKYNAEGRPIWKPMHMQPIFENHVFVTRKENDGKLDVGKDIFQRGLCLPSDNKMTEEQQNMIIEIVKSCFL